MEALLPSRRMTLAKTRDFGFLGIPPMTIPRWNLRSSVLLVTARSPWPEDNMTNCKSFSTPLLAVTADHWIGLREQIQVKAAAEIQEEQIEKVIYRFRFITLLGVLGSLVGSALCFLKGSVVIASSFIQYFSSRGRVISMLIEAIDVYLIGTVMLVFGMGIYELFISNLDVGKKSPSRSNLLGLFKLQERPKWLEIKSVNELKTKVGGSAGWIIREEQESCHHKPYRSPLLCSFNSVLFLWSLPPFQAYASEEINQNSVSNSNSNSCSRSIDCVRLHENISAVGVSLITFRRFFI